MPLLLELHSLDGPVALSDVTVAHRADLPTKGSGGVHYLRYRVDEAAGKFLCLVDAPSAVVAGNVHPRGARSGRPRGLPGHRRAAMT